MPRTHTDDDLTDHDELLDEDPSTGDGPTFRSLGLHGALVQAVLDLGYDEPTPIQAGAIPLLLEGRDLLGLAATGTGKTAAFALPLLHRLMEAGPPEDRNPRALVLVPTRELAKQASRALQDYAKGLPVRGLEVYGGASLFEQQKRLRRGVDVVVGTPGRVLDHLQRGNLDLSGLRMLVLDEADEMLDMGFQEELEAILEQTPASRQTALFSATFPPRLVDIAKRQLRDPARIEARPTTAAERPAIEERLHVVPREHKAAALARVLALEAPEAALVFCRTRADVDGLVELLDHQGTRVEALHGGCSQAERDRVMERLRSGVADLVVATDVAARGLDVDRLSHVVNYDLPEQPEQYVHRIGRTGRAGRSGVAITLAEPRQRRRVRELEQHLGRRIPVAPVPSAEDLRAARLERLGERVLDTLAEARADLAPYRAVAEDLADEIEPLDLVAAALLALARASGQEAGPGEAVPDEAFRPPERPMSPPVGRGPQGRGPHFDEGSWTRLWVGLGKQAGVRPGDLVGAIANEAGIPGSAVGAIQIFPRFSLVAVPSDVARDVVEALNRTTIRGKRVQARRDRET